MTSIDRLGFDADRLQRVRDSIDRDIAAERCDGCVLLVARRGEIVLHEAFGHAHRETGRAARVDDVFFTMSIAKQLTNALVLQRVERGDFMLNTRVAEIIPEYGQKGKQHTTIGDVIIHRAGLPFGAPPLPPEQLGDIQAVTAWACRHVPESVPGTRISYSAIVAHSLLAELVRRVDGGRRGFGQILREDLLQPLGMGDTALGGRADLTARRAPVVGRDRSPGMFDYAMMEAMDSLVVEGYELPAGGAVTTAHDFFRFAEAFRCGGTLDGQRILSPATIRLMVTNQTGDAPNSLWDYARSAAGWPDFPAYLGYGFFVRGEGAYFPTPFGLTASPGTFGGLGAGSNTFWVDPALDLTCVFLSAGLIEEMASTLRHQRLADLVRAAIVD